MEFRPERVIHNLVGNATRFVGPDGDVLVRAWEEPVKDRIVISIANSGLGVPPGRRDSIFAKYARGTQHGQRGMGLYFCRLVCEAHGGSIRLDQDEMDRTRFTIDLPRGSRLAGQASVR
jgi:signal transduction histidine kinase